MILDLERREVLNLLYVLTMGCEYDALKAEKWTRLHTKIWDQLKEHDRKGHEGKEAEE